MHARTHTHTHAHTQQNPKFPKIQLPDLKEDPQLQRAERRRKKHLDGVNSMELQMCAWGAEKIALYVTHFLCLPLKHNGYAEPSKTFIKMNFGKLFSLKPSMSELSALSFDIVTSSASILKCGCLRRTDGLTVKSKT